MYRARALYCISPSLFMYSGFYEDIYKRKNKKYKYQEINKHNNINDKIWVTYKNKVYDITNFIDLHPGGKDNILKAAGGSVEEYWRQYPQHYKEEVINLLKDYEIGEIEDYVPIKDIEEESSEELKNIIYHNTNPQNAEMMPSKIVQSWITPIDDWYIRNHYKIPKVDIKNYSSSTDASNSA